MSDQPEEPKHNPSKEDVSAWLAENDRKRGVPSDAPEKEVPIELSDKAKSLLVEQENEEKVQEVQAPPPESPPNPLYSDELPTQQKSMQFAMDHASLGKIEVTDHEKSLYWKAILNEVPIIFDLEIMDRISVTIQSTSAFDLDVILAAANKDLEEKKIPDGLPAFTGRAQTYAAMMQTRKFNGKECEPVHLFERPYPPLDEAVEKIRKAYQEQHYLHDFPRWNAMIAAVRLFDAKCKICNDRLLDRNFWKPVSSA